MTMAAKKTSVGEVKVDKYPERPLSEALADPEHIKAYEDRQPDQIPDYHEKNPTLKTGPAQKADPLTGEPSD